MYRLVCVYIYISKSTHNQKNTKLVVQLLHLSVQHGVCDSRIPHQYGMH